MYPILARYGPFFLYSYTAVFILSILLALGLIYRWHGERLPTNWLDGVLAGFVWGLLGGRLGFIWLEWDYFRQNTAVLFEVWSGGFSYLGVLGGSLWGVWLWCRWQKRPFLPFIALFAPVIPLLSAAGWFACWLDGCAYGQTTTLHWLSADLPDHLGVFAVRYRTQALGMGLSLLTFGGVLWLRSRVTAVTLFALTLIAFSLSQLLIIPLRGDTAVTIAAGRLDTLLNLFILFAFAALLLATHLRPRRRGAEKNGDF